MTLTCGALDAPTSRRYEGHSYLDLLEKWICNPGIRERRAEVYWFDGFPLFRRPGGGLNGEDTWIFALSHPTTPESAKVELAWDDDDGVPCPYPGRYRIWKRGVSGVEYRTVGGLGNVAALLAEWRGIDESLETETDDSTLDLFAS